MRNQLTNIRPLLAADPPAVAIAAAPSAQPHISGVLQAVLLVNSASRPSMSQLNAPLPCGF